MADIQYEIVRRTDGDVLVLKLPLTALLIEQALTDMKASINAVLDAQPCPNVVLDLSEATGWNSAVFGMLLSIFKRKSEQGGTVLVACMNEHLTSTYQLCGLDRVMPPYNTVAEAIDAL